MEKAVKTIIPKQLASRIGTSPKRVRSILRSLMPRDTKHKNWQLTPEQVKQIIKDYEAQVKQREAKKQEQIKKELESG